MADIGAYLIFYSQAPIRSPIANFFGGFAAKEPYDAKFIAKEYWPENPDRAAFSGTSKKLQSRLPRRLLHEAHDKH